MPLTRKQEFLIRSLRTRHGRRKSGLCLAEGVRCCREVLQRAPELIVFAAATPEAAELAGIKEFTPVTAEALGKLSNSVTCQGIIVVARRPPEGGSPRSPFIVVLDGVADPGNAGTIIRTAKAAGVEDLWYTSGSADPYGDKAVRSALGAQFSMRLREFASLEAAQAAGREHGYRESCITDPHGGENCFTAPGIFDGTLLVIGGEANGVTGGAAGRHVTIPMAGNFESLNAAQAATVLIFEYVRRLNLEEAKL